MIDAVLFATALALIEAVSVMSTATIQNGADGLLVRGGQMGIALKVFWSKGAEDIGDGGHGRRPCMRELMRA